jgi:VWFA-related protein
MRIVTPTSSLLVLLCVLLASPYAGSSVAQEGAESTFGETILVELVNVEVWVTDGEGRPVRGLSKSDFEILEDGRPVEISHFREVDIESRTGSGSHAVRVPEPGLESIENVAPLDVDQGHLIIYLDDLHLRVGARKRMLGELRRFLEQTSVPPEQMLVVHQDEKLTAQTLFGSSKAQIDAALESLAGASPESTLTQQQKWLTLDKLQWTWARLKESARREELPCDEFVRAAQPEIAVYARESHVRVLRTLEHLSSLVTFLAGVPGTKTLLYLSDSLEMGPGEDLLRFVTDLCPTSRRQTTPVALGAALSENFRRLTRHASANRVTIYSIQPEGLSGGFIGSAGQRAVDMRGMRSLQSAARTSEREGLSYLAYETGGRAVFNRNSLLEDFGRIGAEMGAYYSIAYEAPTAGRRVEHRIDVRVHGDFEVRHRRGYREKTRDEEMNERLQSVLYLGLVTNPLDVRLVAGGGTPLGKKNRLRLHVIVPAEHLVFVPGERGAVSKVAVKVLAQGENGRPEAVVERLFQVSEPPEGSDTIDLLLTLDVENGAYDIVVGVRDESSNQASYVSTFLGVAQTNDDR